MKKSILLNRQWLEKTLFEPDWYLKLGWKKYFFLAKLAFIKLFLGKRAYNRSVIDLVSLFAELMEQNKINLANQGDNLDIDRKKIDTVVIHHTANPYPINNNQLSAMQLLTLYVRYYTNPSKKDHYLKGKPIWSNHLRNGKPVFWAYHWLIKQNGEAIRLLNDNEIGWHAGDWSINRRSVALCFDDDLSDKEPGIESLKSAANIIQTNYPNALILGHNETNKCQTCPGNKFNRIWKEKLIKLSSNTK